MSLFSKKPLEIDEIDEVDPPEDNREEPLPEEQGHGSDQRPQTTGELLVAAIAPTLGQTLAPYAIALSHIVALGAGLFVAANSDGTVSAIETQNILIGVAGSIGVYFVPLLPKAKFTNIVKTAVASAAALIAGAFTAAQGGTPSDWLTFGALVIGAVLTGIVDNAPQLAKTIGGAVDVSQTIAAQVNDAMQSVHVEDPQEMSDVAGRPDAH